MSSLVRDPIDPDREIPFDTRYLSVHGIVSLQIEHTHAAHFSMRKARDITRLTLEVLMRGLSR
ncbi:MAG: hypothetical protein ABJE95_19385 [Byssovorax sp.]